MNIDKLRTELEIDEGRKEEIYLDHLGYPTVGIGHLITENDEMLYGSPPGTPVSSELVDHLFEKDIDTVLQDVVRWIPDFYDLPEVVQRVIANMMFQMGYTRLSKFVKFRAAIDERHWRLAAKEMLDSKWATQTPGRAKRLAKRITNPDDDRIHT